MLTMCENGDEPCLLSVVLNAVQTGCTKTAFASWASGAEVQRWLCRNCGYRFSQQKPLQKNQDWQINTPSTLLSKRQVCELLTEESKNLTEVTRQETAQREGTAPDQATIKGKILEFAWHLKKQDRKQTTIKTYVSYLNSLLDNGVNIREPEAVKDFLAKASWKDSSKHTLCHLYSTFLKFLNLQWEPPSYHSKRKLPFIPTEDEIDRFIAASGKKLAAALQTAKETAMRIGEISKVKWTDIDFEKSIVFCNDPEKNCDPGVYSVSPKLISMLNMLPRKGDYIFGPSPRNIMTLIHSTRKTIMRKLGEPRLAALGFHTLRH